MTDFIDGASSTLLVRNANSAHLKRVTSGLHQQWDLPVPSSVQSQEVPSPALLPQIILAFKSCSGAKLEPALLGIISAPLLWKREGKKCLLKEYSQALSWNSSHGLGPSLTKALSSSPEACCLSCVLSSVFTRLEAHLNLPLYVCHLRWV